MRDANRLRKQQDSGYKGSYAAHAASTIRVASTICPGYELHQIIAHNARAPSTDLDQCVGFRCIGQVQVDVQRLPDHFQPKKSCAQMKWPTPAARAAAASIS